MLKKIHNIILYLLGIIVSFPLLKIGGQDIIYPFFFTVIFYIVFFILNWKFYFFHMRKEVFLSAKCLLFLILLYPIAMSVDFFCGYEAIKNLPVREIFFIVITFLISIHLICEKDLVKKYIFSLIFGALLSAVLVEFGFGLYKDVGSDRLSLFGQNQNQSGMEFAFIFGCALFFFFASKNWKSYLFFFPMVMSVIVLFKTGSRGALIGWFLIVLGILFLKKNNVKKILQLIIVSLVAISVLFPVFKENMISFRRLAAVVDGEDSTMAGRTGIWETYLQGFDFASILHGKGFAGYNEYRIKRGMYSERQNGIRLKSSHNEFLKVLSVSGVLGLILYLVFLFTIFRIAFMHFIRGSVFPFICCIPIMVFSCANQVVGSILVHSIYLPLIIYFASDLLYVKNFYETGDLK